MKFREIFRFEFAYQVRRVWTWLFFAGLAVFAFLVTRNSALAEALREDFIINSPFMVAKDAVIACLVWLLVAAPLAGEAAARDVRTGMHPLTYTAPVRKAGYLGGRFLAAFVLNASILLAMQAAAVLAVYLPGANGAVIGPFRPAAHLTAYGFIALPNVFLVTAIQFSLAARSGRPMAGYLGSVLLFFMTYVVSFMVAPLVGRPELARLLDPIGAWNILAELSLSWTPIEKSRRLIGLEGPLLWNRLLWLGIALAALAVTHRSFAFTHRTATPWWRAMMRRRDAHAATHPGTESLGSTTIPVPQVPRPFGYATRARQTLAVAGTSFRAIAKSWAGLALLAATPIAVVVAVGAPAQSLFRAVPSTARVLDLLTAPLTADQSNWVIIPLLIIFYAGELAWRERDAGLGELTDAMPVTEWALFLGKYLGLGIVLVAFTALLTPAGMLGQAIKGVHDFQIGLYLRTLFGLQLIEYLLFALLALVLHVLVDQKYIGYLAAVSAYVFIAIGSVFGIEHNLLVYSAGPGWSYTEMRGFGPSLGPWLWFKLYWIAWALLLAVLARLLWVRGTKEGLRVRLQRARRRLTGATARIAAAAAGLVLVLGGFIFYNTNVLHEYRTASKINELRAEYERRYGRYEGIPQPLLTGTTLYVELYPDRGAVHIRGTYRLVNESAVAIDSIHVATEPGAETETVAFSRHGVAMDEPGDVGDRDAQTLEGAAPPANAPERAGARVALPLEARNGTGRAGEGPGHGVSLAFDRPATRVLTDEELGYHVIALEQPLEPGDSLRLGFEAHYEPRGFGNNGVNAAVVANGTYITGGGVLPAAIGYQRSRELSSARDRRAHGLAPRPLIPSLYDVEARQDRTGDGGIDFEAVVGTSEDQIAVAPGVLRRTWTEGGRSYFHYSTDAPIGNQYAFFSADYDVHEEQWNDVVIQIFHHPGHTANLDRMLRSVRASLDYYSEQFGPYPYSYIRLVEHPGHGSGLHAEAMTIDYEEGFALLNAEVDPGSLDLPFAVLAHELGHQWTVDYAYAEGAPVMSESIAWYSAMGVVEETYGREQLRRLLRFMRRPSPYPPIRRGVPLLRAVDPYAAYRKGPFALFALSEYIGEERVNGALRRLIAADRSGAAPPATTLDLYRGLQAVTPDSLESLLHDLFEVNTFWEFRTEAATAEQTAAGAWQVALELQARKVVADSAGVETEVAMDEWVEIGVFGSAEPGHGRLSAPLYVRRYGVRSGTQTITVTVPRRPVLAGIDPYHVLDWEEREADDNLRTVRIEG